MANLTRPSYAVNNIQTLADITKDQATAVKVLHDKTGADNKAYLENVLLPEIDEKFSIPEGGAAAMAIEAYNKLNKHLDDIAVNVKDYGAKGDGIADDTAAIQAALDTLRNVYIPSGTYIVKNLVPYAGQIITGENYVESWGTSSTVRKTILIGNGGAGDYVIKNYIWATDGEPRAISILDLTIDGNSKATNGILCGNSSLIENCRIQNCIKGIYEASVSRITNCQIVNNTDGIYNATDSKIDGNFIFNNSNGITFNSGDDSVISNNKIEWNNVGVLLSSATYVTIIGNIFDRNTTYGVDSTSTNDITIVGNQFERNLTNHIRGNGARWHVVSNSFRQKNSQDDGSGTMVPSDAIAIVSVSDSSFISNYVYGTKMFKSTYTTATNNVTNGNIINGVNDSELSVTFSGKAITNGNSLSFTVSYPATFSSSEWDVRVIGYSITIDGTGMHYDVYNGIVIKLSSSGVVVTLTNTLGTDQTFAGTIYLKHKTWTKR